MSWTESDIRSAQNAVATAKIHLEQVKRNRDTAKQNGNYKSSTKNCRSRDGKVGNSYDMNVWLAQDKLKQAQESLKYVKAQVAKEKKR